MKYITRKQIKTLWNGRNSLFVSKDRLCRLLVIQVMESEKRIRKICGLLYTPGKREKEEEGTSCGTGSGDVMGATRFVYLDENAGTFAAPT